MHTATRASLISVIAMTVSVILFALFILISGGGSQYGTLILHTMVLLIVVVAANVMMYQIISDRIITPNAGQGQTGHRSDKSPEK
jgi:hypothetical protein